MLPADAGRYSDAEDEIDEHLLQIEMGKALIHHFWVDELKKMLAGAVGLSSILALGTVVFISTEADQCFQSELSPQNCSGVGPEPLPPTEGGCELRQWPRACEPDAYVRCRFAGGEPLCDTCDDRKTWDEFRAEYPEAMLCDEGQAHGLTFIDSLYKVFCDIDEANNDDCDELMMMIYIFDAVFVTKNDHFPLPS